MWDDLPGEIIRHILFLRRVSMLGDVASRIVQRAWRRKTKEITLVRRGCFYEMSCESANPLWDAMGMWWCPSLCLYSCMYQTADELEQRARERGYTVRFVVRMRQNSFLGVSCQRTLQPILFDGRRVRRTARYEN